MRIGLLGGTFDPPHNGHLELARAVQRQLGFEEVLFIPSAKNPLKSRTCSPSKVRCTMVELMIQDEPGLSVSDIETTRGGQSFTVETLEELRMVQNGEYWFIMGSDALAGIQGWKEPDKLISMCRLAVVARSTDDVQSIMRLLPPDYSHVIDVVPMTLIPVSSSKIREDVMRGAPVEHWLKPAVWEYIKKVGLYRE